MQYDFMYLRKGRNVLQEVGYMFIYVIIDNMYLHRRLRSVCSGKSRKLIEKTQSILPGSSETNNQCLESGSNDTFFFVYIYIVHREAMRFLTHFQLINRHPRIINQYKTTIKIFFHQSRKACLSRSTIDTFQILYIGLKHIYGRTKIGLLIIGEDKEIHILGIMQYFLKPFYVQSIEQICI